MLKLKSLSYFCIIVCALLPWNATAINKNSLSNRLFTQQFSGDGSIDSLLVKTLSEIKQGKLNDALNTVNQLIDKTPNFKLAYAIRGDLLAAKMGAVNSFAGVYNGKDADDLKQEAEIRLKSFYDSATKETIQPDLLIKLSKEQLYALVLDVAKSRLYLYAKNDQNELVYVSDYYATIGRNGYDKRVQGDKRTPLGVYFASSKLNQSLPDLYGVAAYPLNYPNEIDLYEKRNGHGIWLHGTPSDTYSRPPRASDGCVVLSNPDLKALQPILNKGNTPVIIANNIRWVKQGPLTLQDDQEQAIENAIESWRSDWASYDTNKYLSHYSKRFFYDNGNYQSWADYKAKVQAVKQDVSIKVSDISMFTYPTARMPMVVVNFEQFFKSPALANQMKKRQYWINENNTWKIIYEGAA
jgi:murein L,D-transpeptidase YafK